MKALVVDDQKAIVEMLTLLLSDLDIDAQGTTDPRQTIDIVIEQKPDLILLDIMMPQVDGLTVLDRLQRDERTAAVPVVLCTASVLTPAQSRVFAAKGIAVLSKPFDIEQLENIVNAIRDRSSIRDGGIARPQDAS